MNNQNQDSRNYDIVSISRSNSPKKSHFVKDALNIEKQQKPTGQFVRVFADIFLSKTAGKKSYF